MDTKLENRFLVNSYPAPLVIYDWMVHAHHVFDWVKELKGTVSEPRFREMVKATWVWSINRGPEMLRQQKWRVVIVADEKDETGGYWRKQMGLTDPSLIQAWKAYDPDGTKPTKYKGHRTPRPDLFWEIEAIGKEYATKHFPIFQQKGFEADDWAGAAARLHDPEEHRQMFLYTVDRDWSMLVDDDKGIYMANSRRCRPRERIQQRLVDNLAVIDHTEYKLEEVISHPRELAFAKSVKGDLGDNLPPGSPIYYFDLVNPPGEWKPENYCPEKANKFKEELLNPDPNIYTEHLQEVYGKFGAHLERVSFFQTD